ncbi:MAG TPA: hypothetical protein VD970_12420, partial [Acetobacteraceae bacterium]|nr:hypothetical protein [Acetobacteraceae bacterium]
VLKRLRQLAAEHDCALLIIHHETKAAEGTALQRLRGAGGIGGAIRSLLSLRPMTADEAKEFEVSEDTADLYVKVETGKQQYARRAKPRWFVTEERELSNGDVAHLLLPWSQPAVAVTPELVSRAVSVLREGLGGEPCSESQNAMASVWKAFEAAAIPKRLHRPILNTLFASKEAQIRTWRDPGARKSFKRIWVARNTIEGWVE